METNQEHSDEAVFKALLVNIDVLKKLDRDNQRLKAAISHNQSILKQEFEKNLRLIEASLNKRWAEKNQRRLFERLMEINIALGNRIEQEKKENLNLLKKNRILAAGARKLFSEKKKLEQINKALAGKIKMLESNLAAAERVAELRFAEERKKLHNDVKKAEMELKRKEALLLLKEKQIVKEFEEKKIEFAKKVILESKRSEFLASKYKSLLSLYEKMCRENKRLEELNVKIKEKSLLLSKKALQTANKREEKARKDMVEANKKISLAMKAHLEKEIEYKAKIESLVADLRRYYSELREQKEKYYKREKELKEKLKEVLG